MKLTIALSNPHQLGTIIECDAEGNITEKKTIICDGVLAAVKVKRSWKEANATA